MAKWPRAWLPRRNFGRGRRRVLWSRFLDSLPRVPRLERRTAQERPQLRDTDARRCPRRSLVNPERNATMKQPNVPSASSAHNESERRSQLLQEQPGVVGAQWAVDACADARSNGRSIEGGWPGTVPEAR